MQFIVCGDSSPGVEATADRVSGEGRVERGEGHRSALRFEFIYWVFSMGNNLELGESNLQSQVLSGYASDWILADPLEASLIDYFSVIEESLNFSSVMSVQPLAWRDLMSRLVISTNPAPLLLSVIHRG